LFLEAVPDAVAVLLRDLPGSGLPPGTYLAGGTALAVHLGHRESIDIDLFTPEHFLTGPLVEMIGRRHAVAVENAGDRDSLLTRTDGVKLTVFHYPYPLIEPATTFEGVSVPLASPSDIAAMKAVAVVQRGTAKDFVDLRALLERFGWGLDSLLEKVRAKFGVAEGYAYNVKKGLVFFDDARAGLADVVLVEAGRRRRITGAEWKETEAFFAALALR
jgi:hypothetical protein